MPSFTIPLCPEGAIVQAVITPSSDDESEGRELSIWGVLDTGAEITVIDKSMIQLLDLEPVAKELVKSITTAVWSDVYRVNVRISAPGTVGPSYYICNVMAVSGELFGVWGHQALFGRNVLEHCLFTYNGVLQTFSLTYGGQG
jgi:hypothetical protein